MLVSGGMTKDATVVFVSAGSSCSGRRSFQRDSIFIFPVFSSCLRRPCSERSFENSASLLMGSPSRSDSSSMRCHSPSLMMEKNFSMFKSGSCMF